MDGICTEDKSTTIETTAPPLEITLCRVGSGGSMVLDPEVGVEAQSRKLPSSRFKGVVPQPNGRWGAQIYEKHQRVWLGTFNEEQEAAQAYDVAVRRFRGGDALTNFQPLQPDAAEGSFLKSRSKAEIVDMLRKHTYDDELQQSKRTQNPNRTGFSDGDTIDVNGGGLLGSGRTRELLFEKTVTPSDVGKLNRLVIPKQHAEKHFPLQHGGPTKGLLLHFEDSDDKVWRFRYSYWNSSQSYVLTKGWSRFVKEKNLKAGDVVSFQISAAPASTDKKFFIGWKTKTGPETTHPAPVQPVQMLRLFGVNILAVASGCGGKRSGSMEMEVLGLRDCKKQRIIDVL